jgi:GAF domain-containing protein
MFDDVTFLAAHICHTPIALITLIDSTRQWVKARVGTDVSETPRDVAFCSHAIASRETLVVPDALEDDRFARNPLVTGEPKIRFYAGAPLLVQEGHALGTLCVVDREPRHLTERQQEALEALSRQVMILLELRRQLTNAKRLAE